MNFWTKKKDPALVPQEPFFLWIHSEHSVGVACFDTEHRFLIKLVNEVHAALIENRDRAQASQLMEHLIQETRLHFFREETALEAAAYPDLEAHMTEHHLALQEAAGLFRLFSTGHISGLAFPSFVKNWLINHIKESDQKYTVCLGSTRQTRPVKPMTSNRGTDLPQREDQFPQATPHDLHTDGKQDEGRDLTDGGSAGIPEATKHLPGETIEDVDRQGGHADAAGDGQEVQKG